VKASELQKRITRYARDRAMPVDRVHHLVGTAVLLSVLEEAKRRGVIATYAVKGGVAFEVRFGMRARATRDVDIALPVPFEAVPRLFDAALAVGYDEFTLRRTGAYKVLKRAATHRSEVVVSYQRKSLFRIPVDVNASETELSVSVESSSILADLGFSGPVFVSFLDDHPQLAQKLHGATEPSRRGYTNLRYRDVLDALLLADNREIDYDRAFTYCRGLFAQRRTHGWPPSLVLDERWQRGLEEEALSNAYDATDADGIAARFNDLIDRIEGVAPTMLRETMRATISFDAFARLTTDPQGPEVELADRLKDGWSMKHVFPDANARHVSIVLEKVPNDGVVPGLRRPQPRLQIRFSTERPVSQNEIPPMRGILRNVGSPANFVRLEVPGLDPDYGALSNQRIGSIAKGDEIPIELETRMSGELQQPANPGPWQITYEFEDDHAQKFRQVGQLETSLGFGNVRIFQVRGLESPIPIERYSMKYRHEDVL
jgi:Nucleotidyl transferase AbiEii toxin, Type IV TA system